MSSATAAASLPFELVDVKLAAPLMRPGAVAKERLIERLRTSDAPFAIVVAPAGYGKTTLLSFEALSEPGVAYPACLDVLAALFGLRVTPVTGAALERRDP
jgi:hypothetical protein